MTAQSKLKNTLLALGATILLAPFVTDTSAQAGHRYGWGGGYGRHVVVHRHVVHRPIVRRVVYRPYRPVVRRVVVVERPIIYRPFRPAFRRVVVVHRPFFPRVRYGHFGRPYGWGHRVAFGPRWRGGWW
jgi:hypothetical protein